mmetsp:Transcript_27152/g.49027  ORF Transcript_27152/g.49027 Transcript_27152/m.49027 type:complete len:142 (-) Transcript_27152:137-562(-)
MAKVGESLRSKASMVSKYCAKGRKTVRDFWPSQGLPQPDFERSWDQVIMFPPQDQAQNLGPGANQGQKWTQQPQNLWTLEAATAPIVLGGVAEMSAQCTSSKKGDESTKSELSHVQSIFLEICPTSFPSPGSRTCHRDPEA